MARRDARENGDCSFRLILGGKCCGLIDLGIDGGGRGAELYF
jgi:hypothetical protein